MIDQKAAVVMSVKKEDRVYEFHMPMNSPLGECYDACFEMMNEIVTMSQKAAERAERKDVDEKKTDANADSNTEVKPEVVDTSVADTSVVGDAKA